MAFATEVGALELLLERVHASDLSVHGMVDGLGRAHGWRARCRREAAAVGELDQAAKVAADRVREALRLDREQAGEGQAAGVAGGARVAREHLGDVALGFDAKAGADLCEIGIGGLWPCMEEREVVTYGAVIADRCRQKLSTATPAIFHPRNRPRRRPHRRRES